MADPFQVLREITEGIFKIWSRARNVKENVIFDHFFRKSFPKYWAKIATLFLDITGSRPNFKNPYAYFT